MKKLPICLTFLSFLALNSCINNTGTSGGSTYNQTSWHEFANSDESKKLSLNDLEIESDGGVYMAGVYDAQQAVLIATSSLDHWQHAHVSDFTTHLYQNEHFQLHFDSLDAKQLLINHAHQILVNENEYLTDFPIMVAMLASYDPAANEVQVVANSFSHNNAIYNKIAVDSQDNVYAAYFNYSVDLNRSDSGVLLINNSTQQLVGGAFPDGGIVGAMLIDRKDNLYVALASYEQEDAQKFSKVLHYNSDTNNWDLFASANIPESAPILSLVSYDNKIYAATSNGYILQSENGAPWQAIVATVIPDHGAITALAVSATGKLYAATDQGSVYTITPDHNWQLVAGGSVPNHAAITALALFQDNLFVATQVGKGYVSKINL